MSEMRVNRQGWDRQAEFSAFEVVGAIESQAGPLPQVSLAYEAETKLLWVTMRPEPKPVLTLQLIESLRKIQLAIRDVWASGPDRPILFAALRAHPRVFSLGGDLDFFLDCLAKNDRSALEHYARLACEAIEFSRNGLWGTTITLSAVQGRAMGGGIDTARGCNLLIAEEGATFTYPEVNYNHYPIAAVPVLSRHAGLVEAGRIVLSGAEFSAAELHMRGVVDGLAPTGGAEDWVRSYARSALMSQPARVGVIAACNRQAGDFAAELRAGVPAWVGHMMTLKPLEISRLQRIAIAQERMLGRLLRADAGMTAPA